MPLKETQLSTKGLRAEIKYTEKCIAEVKKQILKMKVDIKQLQTAECEENHC